MRERRMGWFVLWDTDQGGCFIDIVCTFAPSSTYSARDGRTAMIPDSIATHSWNDSTLSGDDGGVSPPEQLPGKPEQLPGSKTLSLTSTSGVDHERRIRSAMCLSKIQAAHL